MKILPIVGFLFLALAILLGVHLFVFNFLVKTYGLSGRTKQILSLLFLFLSISFLIGSFLVKISENYFAKGFYYFAGVWLVMVFYLFLACLVVWLVDRAIKIDFDLVRIVVNFLTIIICLLIGNGIWNASRIKVKEIEIPIKNLPENWQNKKIVQISDVHLGTIFGAGFINQIIAQVNGLGPEAVFITGDYFDGMDGNSTALAMPLNKIIAPKGVYFITGNHETYLGVESVVKAFKQTKVKVLDDERVDLGGISLIGINYPAEFEKKELPDIIKKINPPRPAILLYHAPVQIENITGIDLMLAGHTHNGQIFPFNLIVKSVFGKFSNGLNRINDFFIFTSVGVGTWGPPLRIGNSPEIVAIKLVREN